MLMRRTALCADRARVALVALCALGFFGLASEAGAQTTNLKFQASFPPSSLIFESSKLFTQRVEQLSGGRLKIEMLPAGTVVGAFEVLDATSKGVIDGAHSAAAYWTGKNKAATLFGPAPGGPFGMDMLDYLGWIYEGGGLDLYREFFQDVLKSNVVVIPLSPVGNQVLGWFKRPVKGWADLKGRKCRETGVTAEVFVQSGMSVVNIPGGEIVPAGERGVIDCGEWVGPAEDMKIGFQNIWKYYYMPSTHEPATVLELLINGDVWKKLPRDLQEIMQSAAMEVNLRTQILLNRANADALRELADRHGVKVERTPSDILVKILESWDKIARAEYEKNAFFRKVYDSQKAYAAKVVPARRFVYPPYDFVANYYWPVKK
jgi:TRAP-type mannitol/chloroaromatic compound transport system substrate-binding protein